MLILFFYKYLSFFINSTYKTIPLGISFYIFNQIAFIIDCYYLRIKKPEFTKFFFLIIYFPHLIAGPFLRYSPIITQLKNNKYFNLSLEKIFFGLIIFCIGLFKKTVIADHLGIYVDNFHFNLNNKLLSPELLSSWIASVAFSFQLYFDFSGYSDMAIGISMFFGIKLPVNFNSPFKSNNIINFWKNWHITLGKYIFEFIYMPLSVYLERKFFDYKGKIFHSIKTIAPLLITFLIVGLWHGSGRNNFETVINFSIFGLLHGFLYYFNYIIKDYKIINNKILKKIVSIFFTFNLVNFTFVFFRSSNLHNATEIVKSMLCLNGIDFYFITNNLVKFGYSNRSDALLFLIIFISSFFVVFLGFNFNKFSEDFNFQKKILKNSLLFNSIIIFSSLITVISIINIKKITTFLYINF